MHDLFGEEDRDTGKRNGDAAGALPISAGEKPVERRGQARMGGWKMSLPNRPEGTAASMGIAG